MLKLLLWKASDCYSLVKLNYKVNTIIINKESVVNIFKSAICVFTSAIIIGCSATSADSGPIKVLIVDGQNNHTVWPKSTHMMKQTLEQSKRF
jgi:hypothetical protein